MPCDAAGLLKALSAYLILVQYMACGVEIPVTAAAVAACTYQPVEQQSAGMEAVLLCHFAPAFCALSARQVQDSEAKGVYV